MLKGKQIGDKIKVSDGHGHVWADEIEDIKALYRTKDGYVFTEEGKIAEIKQFCSRYVIKK